MSDIKLSIITATYNAAQHLPRLIDSLLAQTDQDFEWVVVDGASTDGTLQLLEAVRPKFKKLIVDSRPDFGIYDALNRAVKIVSGDYYLVAGADDCFYPTAVYEFKKACAVSGVEFVSAAVRVNGKVVKYRTPRWVWLFGPSALVSSHAVGLAIGSKLHDKYGIYDVSYKIYADSAFMLKCIKAGCKVINADFVSGEFCSNGASNSNKFVSFIEQFRAQISNGGSLIIQSILCLLRVLKWRKEIRSWAMRNG